MPKLVDEEDDGIIKSLTKGAGALSKSIGVLPKPVSSASVSPRSSSSTWFWPTTRTAVTQNVSGRHVAIDIAGARGAPVYSPTRAVIQDLKYQEEGYGMNVRLQTDSGLTIILGHLDAFLQNLRVGQTVEAGQQVGLLGSSGASSGPHLHLEVRQPGFATDRFTPGYGSGIGAIDPRQFFGTSPSVPSGRVDASTSTYSFAPVTRASVTTDTIKSGDKIVSKANGSSPQSPYPGIPAGYAMATGGETPSETGMRVGTLFGLPVTISKPGKAFTGFVIVAVGIIILLIGIAMLATRKAEGAVQSIPGTAPWLSKKLRTSAGRREAVDLGKKIATRGAA